MIACFADSVTLSISYLKEIVYEKAVSFYCDFGRHFTTHVQDLLKKASGTASAAGFDVNKLTSSIMGKLVPKLGLSDTQKPGVTDAVAGFLGEKSKILPLQQTDAASYATKQGGLFNTLKSKLGSILVAGQMQKFLGLKPKTNDAANVLSNLFY